MEQNSFSIMHNVGKAKYVVNYHIKGRYYQDGSLFYDIALFKSKKKMDEFIEKLTSEIFPQHA